MSNEQWGKFEGIESDVREIGDCHRVTGGRSTFYTFTYGRYTALLKMEGRIRNPFSLYAVSGYPNEL